MKPSSGRQTCDCCRDICNDEFQKFVELKDVGVTIYRYLPQLQDENDMSTETGEVFILQNTGSDDLKIEELMESGKRKMSCPRCIKMIQHVKSLFMNLPANNMREVTGVCDHCYQKELLHCTCCEHIVDKFLKFRMEEAIQIEENRQHNKEWLVKSQVLLKKSISNAKDSKLEPRSKSEGLFQQSHMSTSINIPNIKPAEEPALNPDVYDRLKAVSGPIYEHGKHSPVDEYYQVSASRKILTIEPIQEPALVPEIYEKQKIIGETKLSHERGKYHLAQQNVDKAFRDLMSRDKHRPRTESEDQFQGPQASTSKNIPTIKPLQEHSSKQGVRDRFLEISEKQKAKRETELIHPPKKYRLPQEDKTLRVLSFLDFPESIGRSEDDIKLQPMKVKAGILKSRDYSARDDVTIPSGKQKRPASPTSRYSFGTLMKSLSEPNVSVFSYSFPHDKIPVNQQIVGHMSSSELIKNTQEMLQDRIEEEKKKKIELEKLKEEKKKMAEKEREIILKEAEKVREEMLAGKGRDMKYKGAANVREEDTAQITEKDQKEFIRSVSSLKDHLAKQIKELPEEEKTKKQKEKGVPTEDKKAKESEKPIDDKQQLATEKKMKHTEAALESEYDRRDKIYQDNESEAREKKITEREKQPHELGTTSVLKYQVTKEEKEISGEEKLKKQEITLVETKGEDTEKALKGKGKQLTTQSKRKLTEIKSKGEIGKDEPPDKTPKEPKVKDDKHSEMAATLIAQMAKQKQLEIEKERLRKEQQRERELVEKKMKELEAKKEINAAPLKKPPILVPELEEADNDDITEVILKPEEVSAMIKGQKIYKIKGSKIIEENQPTIGSMQYTGPNTTIQRSELTKSKQHTKQKTAKQERELTNSKQYIEHKNAKQESELPKHSKQQKQLTEQKALEATLHNTQKAPGATQNTQQKALEATLNTQQKAPGANQNTQKKTPGETQNTQLKPPGVTQNTQQKAPGAIMNTQQKAPVDTINKQKLAAANAEKNPKAQLPDPDATKGVIRYTLSDRSFIDKGWTMLPTEKVVRKMNVYRMRPAKPEFDWFEHNKYKREMSYDTGERLAEFDDNGRGRWYYRSGELALDYYDAEETNAGQRFVVYSTVLPDERGRARPRTVLATFDYSGNGIVFDHTGKIRLKYNQTEGVVLDRTIGPVSHWKWHTLNDPPVLQQVMIDTQMPYKDPTILQMGDKQADQKRPDNEEMIAIEFENFLKEKRQKLTQSFKPFQIKMKAMKINEYFSLRVMDQASVYLLYRDGTTNLKINIGMVLDHKEIVDTDTAEIGEVSNTLDKLPACTDSIAGLQKAVARAQAVERSRVRHERRLKRSEMTSSIDALHAACSRPPRTPIVQASLSSCDKMTPRRFKPSCCDLYYSTQY